MKDNRKYLRYFCKDETGRDLFYIELDFDEGTDLIYFNTSLQYPIFNYDKVSEIINCLTLKKTSDVEMQKLINILFSFIRTLPNVESGYFSDELIDKTGTYMDYYDSVTSALLRDKDFDDYTVFSPSVNAFYFDYAVPIIKNEIISKNFYSMNKSEFEMLVKNGVELALEYVNLYSENAEYFRSIFSHENNYEFYIMIIKSDVKLLFIKKCK